MSRLTEKRTPGEVYAFLVKAGIINPNERTLSGQEAIDIHLLLQLVDPYKSTNNQRFWTDYYKIGGKEYKITHFGEDEYEIVEINDIQQD
jgi:hypothetical protein